MIFHVAGSSDLLSRRFAERDGLLAWIDKLEDASADQRAIAEVREELDRVLRELRHLGVPDI